MTRFIVALTTLISIPACSQQVPNPTTLATSSLTSPLTTWLTGDAADVQRATTGGSVLMGGSKDVDAALRWMIQKSGEGVNSVETILINSRIVANDAAVEQKNQECRGYFYCRGRPGQLRQLLERHKGGGRAQFSYQQQKSAGWWHECRVCYSE